MRTSSLLLMGAIIAAAVPAMADVKDTLQDARPPVFEALLNCRNITSATERLACFDAKVTAMDEA